MGERAIERDKEGKKQKNNSSKEEINKCCFIPFYKGYSNHLNTGLVWYSNGRFGSGYQMVWYSNGGLKTRLKKACIWSKMSGI